MAVPILGTKLSMPPLRSKTIQRPKLIHRLNEGLELNHQVTLVSAPAGYGKSTCIRDWVNVLGDWQVAWLSLDAFDDAPARFFTYFIAAIQKMQANLGQEIVGVIGSGQLPPGEVISSTLINDLLGYEGRLIIVLDDFHVIQDLSILHPLEYLIENIPDRLHLVLITREDPPLPLARLRANNQLTEIRARDLRFTQAEVDRFLREVMGLALSPVDIHAIEDKTEGWIAGLQLAAMAIREPAAQQSPHLPQPGQAQEEPSRVITRLSGSHRYLLSYLTEQVLDKQSETVRRFLFETSILEKLNGDLCNTITGRTDSEDLLEQLLNANLFLIPLDNERRWYRYHHLFADLLQDLQHSHREEKKSELHRRASRWFAQTGMFNDAIRHALAGEDYATAVDLLEGHAMELIMQGFAKTVNAWVQALPEEWRSRGLKTNLAFAWALLLRGEYAEASVYLERLETILRDLPSGEENPAIYAEWQAMQSLVLYMQGRLVACREMAVEVLARTQEQDHRVRSLAWYVQASVSRLEEKYPEAVEGYQQSIRESRAAVSPVPEMLSTASLAGMALERGQLHMAFEVASQAVQRIERSGILYPISAMIYAVLGEVCYQWYQLEEAVRHFQQALHLSILGGANTITILCRLLLSRLALTEGDLETASREIQAAEYHVPPDAPAYIRQEVVSQRVRVSLTSNRLAAAEVALQEIGIPFRDLRASLDMLTGPTGSDPAFQQIPSSAGLLFNNILRLFLYQARAAHDPARVLPAVPYVDQFIDWAFQRQQRVVALEALLLRAQIHTLLRDQTSSTTDYIHALELAQTEGFVSIFMEGDRPVADAMVDLARRDQVGQVQPGYLERLLYILSKLHPPQSGPAVQMVAAADDRSELVEPLTKRELEVLRLMGEGLKYKEIGARLYISKNTVRYHVKAIYGKLQVNNRMQAVAKARLLHLL